MKQDVNNYFLLICLIFSAGYGVPLISAPGILDESGVVLGKTDHSKQWSAEEIKQVEDFLQSLPQKLVHQKGRLTFYKDARKLAHTRHADRTVINVRTSSDDRSKDIQRQILHYILHRYDRHAKVSLSKAWRSISGWRSRFFGLLISAENRSNRAYANRRGKENPQEDFVTAAVHFFLPPPSTMETSLKCQLPEKYRFLREYFSGYQSPLESTQRSCKPMAEGLLDDLIFFDGQTSEKINLGPVTTQTVSGFELLYATPGAADAAEIAGHLLLRVKLDNNPEATRLGVENPNDLVISFLANTDPELAHTEQAYPIKKQCSDSWFMHNSENYNPWKSILQPLKGLSGGFLTVMDRQTLAQAVKHYTIEEDRNLLRYALVLNTSQKGSLLRQLFIAKKNYGARYYFFNQNCASVLVRIIGNGIGSNAIANFDPIVSPPNTLVAMFLRRGLVKPVQPAFYSYRSKGFMAQDMIKTRYKSLIGAHAGIPWPAIEPLFDNNEKRRLAVVKNLQQFAFDHPQIQQDLYALLTMVQEAELSYSRKNLICENYTSRVTAQARAAQLAIMHRQSKQLPAEYHQRDAMVHFSNLESLAQRQGVPHTKLFAREIRMGGAVDQHNHRKGLTRLSMTLDRQEMGSISSVSMQRGSAVELGTVSVDLDMDEQQNDHAWHITTLHIRKFRERIHKTPSFFHPAGSVGLGLSLLNFHHNVLAGQTYGSWFGGELLINLFASDYNNRYAFVSIGADLRHQSRSQEQSYSRLAVPISIESLWTLDTTRLWQWRSKLRYFQPTENRLHPETHAGTELIYRAGKIRNRLVLLKLAGEYHRLDIRDQQDQSKTFASLGIEIDPW